MLQPSHPAYRKAFKGRIGSGYGNARLVFGHRGLRTREKSRLSARQLEASRRSLRRHLARTGLVWRLPYPAVPVTAKPSEVRRGKGKGAVAYWAARLRPGSRIFEVGGNVSDALARSALSAAAKKLPVATRLSVRREPLL